jgi:hypothetical protein
MLSAACLPLVFADRKPYNVLAASSKRTEPCKRQKPSLSGPFTFLRQASNGRPTYCSASDA